MRIESETPLVLDVRLECRGRLRGLALADAALAPYVSRPSAGRVPLRVRGQSFELDAPLRDPVFRYRVDLEGLARDRADVDLALRRGGSLLAPASSYLLHPLPLELGVPVEVRVEVPPGVAFQSALARRADGAFALEAHELPVATYSVFGRYAARTLAIDSHGQLELVVLDGGLRVSEDELARWVEQRARVVAEFYGRMPARRVVVFLVPVEGRGDVAFGKLLPGSAPGIVVLLGSDAGADALTRDWILTHELFHVGVPSFYKEGKWFDEGLATYFEPILRARAGLLSELELWTSFAREMPKGVSALTRYGLERSPDYERVYWGGAVFCLMADIEIRTSSGLHQGLEDGVRAVFEAGGSAWDVWSLERALAVADRSFGEPVLGRLARRYAGAPSSFDLERLLAELGVVRRAGSGAIELRDDAPLAAVRRAIVHPPPRRPNGPHSTE